MNMTNNNKIVRADIDAKVTKLSYSCTHEAYSKQLSDK